MRLCKSHIEEKERKTENVRKNYSAESVDKYLLYYHTIIVYIYLCKYLYIDKVNKMSFKIFIDKVNKYLICYD